MNINYQNTLIPSLNDLQKLYDNVGWTAYTRNMPQLYRAIQKSLTVITAWHDKQLVGLLRAVGDGETILYIQDILVQQTYQRQGIGTQLVQRILVQYQHVRQIVLLTDDGNQQRQFYQSLGFRACDDGRLIAFAKINQ